MNSSRYVEHSKKRCARGVCERITVGSWGGVTSQFRASAVAIGRGKTLTWPRVPFSDEIYVSPHFPSLRTESFFDPVRLLACLMAS